MTTLTITDDGSDTQDLRSNDYFNIARIDLLADDLFGATVQFSSDQFGAGAISNSVTIGKSGNWSLEVYVASGATFSAANWRADNYPLLDRMFAFYDTNSSTRETITGSRYADRIFTSGGGDAVRGGAGNDTITFYQGALGAGALFDGGAGRDTFSLLLSDNGADESTDFTLASVSGFEVLSFGTYNSSGGPTPSDVISTATFSAAQFASVDTVTSGIDTAHLVVKGSVVDLSKVSFVPGAAPNAGTATIDISIVGAGANSVLTGSTLADTITASPNGSRMIGGLGADALIGGAGNDVFVLTARDTQEGGYASGSGSGSSDTVELVTLKNGDEFMGSFYYCPIVKFTGGFDSTLFAGANTFRFLTAATIVGSSAHDAVVLDAVPHYKTNFSNLSFQNWSAGDTVTIISWGNGSTTGTPVADAIQGGAGAETLDGQGGNDTLTGSSGDDTLIGGAGNDRMIGGTGNDTYVYAAGDTIVEAANQGSDTIQIAASVNLAGFANVENATLTGSAAINAAGTAVANALTGNNAANQLNGGDGNDTLTGNGGADTLVGGAGNDTYVNPQGDTIVEAAGAAGGSHDTVSTSASFSLAALANVEDVLLTGTGNTGATGNSLSNTLTGNTGANKLTGVNGNDTLSGAAGDDTLLGGNGTDRLIGGEGRDTIDPGADANADTIVIAFTVDSTSTTRDLIVAPDFDHDKLALGVVPTGLSFGVTTEPFNEATFDADLAAFCDNGTLPAGQAILYDPGSGDLDQAGMMYLIVDANGVAGYQAGADYVIQIQNYSGTLDITDFLLAP